MIVVNVQYWSVLTDQAMIVVTYIGVQLDSELYSQTGDNNVLTSLDSHVGDEP